MADAGQTAPVIAEAALEQCFVAGLAWSGVAGLQGGPATWSLAAAEGKIVGLPAGPFAGAKDEEAVCRAVAGIGSVYFCPDCRESDLSAVSSG